MKDRVTELYKAYGSAIYARCVRLLGDHVAAEDATQETFLRAHRHLATLPDDGKAFSWIYQVATNLCLTTLRNRKLTVEVPDHLVMEGSLEKLFADRDLATRIIAQAGERYRVLAWMYYVDEIPQGEIAQILGISRRTVITRLAEFAEDARRFVGKPR